MKHIDIYTDGSCLSNPGPGGYCAILRYGGKEKVVCGGQANTTNNRMELTAAIMALQALKESCDITLYSDSKYLVDAIQKGWAAKWKANNWIKGDRQKALNPDLWEQLLQLLSLHSVQLVWVKGHAGHPENERCDKIAVLEAQKQK